MAQDLLLRLGYIIFQMTAALPHSADVNPHFRGPGHHEFGTAEGCRSR